MKIPALLLAAAAACLGAIQDVRVLGTTATQAVLAYTPPDGNACILQVSQNQGLAPLIPDVDPNIFAGANVDLSRPGTVTAGAGRLVVIGQRTAQFATAGPYTGLRHFSRAAQAATTHYGLITCPSTGDTATFTFATTNIPIGSTYGEPWLSDPAHPGDQPWPETPGAATTESFVDPLTGLLLQRVSVRGNGYGYWPAMPFSTAQNQGNAPCSSTGGWSNPCNALLSGSSYATIGNSTAWLVLRNMMTNGNAWGGYTGNTTYGSGAQIDQLRLNLSAKIPGCAGDACKLDACVSMNGGASCAGPILTATFSGSLSTQTFGSADVTQFGATPWVFDTNPKFNMQESIGHKGTAAASGTTMTWLSGDPFSLYWINSTVRLSPTSTANACAPPPATNDSTEYTVVSFADGNNLTLSSEPGNGTYYFCAQPFSIMVRRHAADSNTASVQSASMAGTESYFPAYASNGANTAAFNTPVGGGWFVSFGGLSWINPVTGQIIYYGQPYMQPGPPQNPWLGNRGCPGPNAAFWDNTQTIPTWYCSTIENGKTVVVRAKLIGGVPPAPTVPYSDLAFETGCSSTDSYTITCVLGGGVSLIFDVLTPGSLNQDLNTQLAALDPTIAATLAAWGGTPSRTDQFVEKGVFYTSFFSTGAQDSPAIILAFSPGDGVPAHAGQSGGPKLIGAVTSYNTGPVITNPTSLPPQTSMYGRTLHGPVESGGTGWIVIRLNNASYVPVNTTHTSIPASSGTCASLGITGNNNQCIQLQIDSYTHAGATGYDPYLTNGDLRAPFTGAPGEFRSMQVGDLACVEYSATQSPIQSQQCFYQGAEMMMLVLNNGGGSIIMQRNMYGYEGARNSGQPITLYWSSLETSHPYQAHANYFGAFWNPLTGCSGSADPHGNCMIQDPNDDGGHGFWRDGSATGAINVPAWITFGQWPNGYRGVLGPVPASTSYPWANNIPDTMPGGVSGVNIVHGNPSFAGAVGGSWPGEASLHPNPPAALASAYEQARAFDDVTFAGGAFFAFDPTFINVSGQLYSSTVSVTDADNIGSLNRKLLGTAASCGIHPLIDVSGPGSVLDGSTANSYKYCIPRANGECVSGSAVGQIYVNCPGLIPPLTCNGNGLHGSSQLGVGNDVCVHNAAATLNAISQFSVDHTDYTGAGRRTLVTDIGRIRMSAGFDNARLLPDNSGMLFGNWWSEFQSASMWMAKMLPYPASDSVNRGNFVPVTVAVAALPQVPVNNAIVEFGYAEYGAPAALNCTTRNDLCIANQASLPPAGSAPFQFASESPAGVSCANGCTITIPALSQRVLYCRVQYRTASNSVILTSEYQVIVAP